jgi:MAF protein
MSEKKIPLRTAEAKESIPAYEDVAIQHAAPHTRIPPVGATTGAKPVPRGPFPLDIPVLNLLRGKRIILASASPRRKQILSTVCRYFSYI